MSAARATLISIILLTSFITLTTFFASLYNLQNPNDQQNVSFDGYGINPNIDAEAQKNATSPYKTASSL